MSQYESNFYGSGGGGYVQGGSPFSQGGSPGGKRTEVSQSVRPFTISQLNRASQAHNDAEWKVDDSEIGQITIVGQVNSIQRQATNHVYVIDDGTGRTEARQWIASSDDDDSRNDGIAVHKYVRIIGGLKSFGRKRYVNITRIRPISDPHEIYFHILEAITVSLIVERGPPFNANASPQTKTGNAVSAYSAQPNTQATKSKFAHLPPLQRAIIEFIMSQPHTEEGVHVSRIATAVHETDAHKISIALDEMMDDGHVFTTFDDSHFRVS